MRLRPVLLILVAAVLAAETQSVLAQTPPDSASQIASIRDEWVRDWNTKNLDALVALYAPNAVLLPAAGQPIKGGAAIRDYFKQLMDQSVGDLNLKSTSIEASGALGYDSGSFEYTIKGGGAVMGGKAVMGGQAQMGGGALRRVQGYYLVVLRRGQEGKWLIVQHASTEIAPSK